MLLDSTLEELKKYKIKAMTTRNLSLIIFIALFFTACIQKEKTCVIKGKVINRPNCTKLIFSKYFDDMRSKAAVMIPVQDSIFTYEFTYKDSEAYNLVCEKEYNSGSWRSITFFPVNGTVEIEIHPRNDAEKNVVVGGEVNKQYSDYIKIRNSEFNKTKPIWDSINALREKGLYNTPVVEDLRKRMRKASTQQDKRNIWDQINKLEKSGKGLSPEANKLQEQLDSVNRYLVNKRLNIIDNNITIINYFALVGDIVISKHYPKLYNIDRLSLSQKKYAAEFKDHPYTRYSNELLWSTHNIKEGGKIYDFTLPDMNGKEYTLSDEIKGKYAFIDIWAPWCGPCINKGRKMKAVFDKYKDKDFTVIAVASKYRDIANVKRILKQDNYPWITLIDKPELDSRINEHYGVKNAGGITVLVDKEGKIVLVNPALDDVRKYLKANL